VRGRVIVVIISDQQGSERHIMTTGSPITMPSTICECEAWHIRTWVWGKPAAPAGSICRRLSENPLSRARLLQEDRALTPKRRGLTHRDRRSHYGSRCLNGWRSQFAMSSGGQKARPCFRPKNPGHLVSRPEFVDLFGDEAFVGKPCAPASDRGLRRVAPGRFSASSSRR